MDATKRARRDEVEFSEPMETISRRKLHLVTPGEVITTDTGFMR